MQSTAIIGAGLAGLVLARHLVVAGQPVQLFDKGRGVGGRCATRRVSLDDGSTVGFDHGLQLLDPDQPPHRLLLALAGLTPTAVTIDGRRLWRIGAGASSLAKALADGLPVNLQTTITRIERAGTGQWLLHDDAERVHGPFDAVVLTCPPVQTRALWPQSAGSFPVRLARARMTPCWSAMIVLDRPVARANGFVGAPLVSDWLASWDDGRSWLLHADPAWSQAQLEMEPWLATAALTERLFDHLPADAQVVHASAHRWRFARTEAPAADPAWWHGGLRLGVCGDWCAGEGAGAAFTSAALLAQLMVPAGS